MIFKGYIASIAYAFFCLLIAFFAYKAGVSKKITRKIVHILVGFEWIILYCFMGTSIHFLAVCLLFLLILTVAHFARLMPMISSDGDNSPGTVYYAAAMSVMGLLALFIPNLMLPFGVGVFCTSLGDGFAGLVGQGITHRVNRKIYGNKTIFGTLASFIVCALSVGVMNAAFAIGLQMWHIFAIAFFAASLELFTGRGLDNITVTLGASILTYLLVYYPTVENYIVPILLTPMLVAFSYTKNALTRGGIAAAILLDILISFSLGNFGFTLLFSFFALGVVVDKIKKRYNNSEQNIEKKGSRRDSAQVLANGLVPCICAVLYVVFKKQIFIIAFVASLSEALADTAASGIGSFAKHTFDPFKMRKCERGLSGGMSLIGTFSALVGASIISLIAFAFGRISLADILTVTLIGFVGTVFDSLLGSLAQIKYKCNVCGAVVEREEHCGEKTVHYSGISPANNDTVNLLSTIFTAALAAYIYYI